MIMDRILHAVALICHEMPVAVASISLRTWWNCMIADRIYVRIYALKCNFFFPAVFTHYIPIIMYQGLKMKKREHHGHVLGQKEAVVE